MKYLLYLAFWAYLAGCSSHPTINPGSLKSDLTSYFSDLQGKIEFKQMGEDLLIKGELDDPKDLQRLNKVIYAISMLGTKALPVKNLATLTEKGKERFCRQIERDVGVIGVKVSYRQDAIFLDGSLSSNYLADRAVEITKSHVMALNGESFSRSGPAPASITMLSNRVNFGGPEQIIDMIRLRPAPIPKSK